MRRHWTAATAAGWLRASLLMQPVAFSWLHNSRVTCCLHAAATATATGDAGPNSTAQTTLADDSSSRQQQSAGGDAAASASAHSHRRHQQHRSFLHTHAAGAAAQLWARQYGTSSRHQAAHSQLRQAGTPQQAAHLSSSSSSSSNNKQGEEDHHPYQQRLHGIHPSSQQPGIWADPASPLHTSTNSTGAEQQQQQQQQQAIQGEVTVTPFPQQEWGYSPYGSSSEGANGSNGFRHRSFRRREPQFQVIEFPADGTATESFIPRTAAELGLHPRDVTLFAPLSRLAAPQRATIAVHDGKILVKTEIVKAIITADKAVLIKSRRQHDTQKLAQAILAANDARLRAIQLTRHQQEQLTSSIVPGLDGSLMGSCERAASAADLLRAAAAAHGRGGSSSSISSSSHGMMRTAVSTAGGTYTFRPGGGGTPPAAVQHQQRQQQGAFGRGGDPGGFGSRLQPSSVSAGQQMVAQAAGSELKDVPFEMLVLEVLLDATTEYFYTKVQHLNWMLESIAADIRQGNQPWQGGAIDKAHQLIPIQKFMTSLKNDVRETCDALKAVLSDDETLEELCLSWHVQQRQHSRWTPVELQKHKAGLWSDGNGNGGNGNGNGNGSKALSPDTQVRLLTEMLESYEREIQSLEGSINEAEEDLDNTRSIWHMQLDSSRNHIIMVNLWLSIVNISVMGTTILPAFFGMNLSSGLSDTDPTFFYAVCGCSLALAIGSYPVARLWFFRNWKQANQSKEFEHKVLRVLLVQHIEDVGSILSALRAARYRHLDRKGFRSLMYDTLGNRAMSATNIDFLWEAFDRDRDAFLAEAEHLLPINNYHSSSSSTSTSSSSSSTAKANPAAAAAGTAAAAAAGVGAADGGFAGLPPAAAQHPAAGLMPPQLGSLEGLVGRGPGPTSGVQQQGEVWPGPLYGESLAQWQGRGLINSVRATPYQQHKQQQQYKQEQQQHYEQQQQQPPAAHQQQQQQKAAGKEESNTWEDDDRFRWD